MTPAVVIRPIRGPPVSVNHKLPSGPVTMERGPLPAVGRGNSVKTPAVVIRPILLPLFSVNHSAPSGPKVIPSGGARRGSYEFIGNNARSRDSSNPACSELGE